jgi:hypothetical protein
MTLGRYTPPYFSHNLSSKKKLNSPWPQNTYLVYVKTVREISLLISGYPVARISEKLLGELNTGGFSQEIEE